MANAKPTCACPYRATVTQIAGIALNFGLETKRLCRRAIQVKARKHSVRRSRAAGGLADRADLPAELERHWDVL